MAYETEDLTDKRFGALIVLWKNKQSRNGGASWLCRCSCGRLCTVGGKILMNHQKSNCGDCNYGHYYYHPDYMECVLPSGEKFQIDHTDYSKVAKHKWVTNAAGYFVASLGRKDNHIFLHRLVMAPENGMYVDHIDGNKGNCRRSNLRFCTYAENNRNMKISKRNSSGYKGVHWASDRRKWRAEITVNGKHIRLGSYDSIDEAAEVYDKAATFYFGEFAKTNKMLGNFEAKQGGM